MKSGTIIDYHKLGLEECPKCKIKPMNILQETDDIYDECCEIPIVTHTSKESCNNCGLIYYTGDEISDEQWEENAKYLNLIRDKK